MSTDELVTFLDGLVVRIVEILRSEPFDTGPAREIGVALVDARLTGARVLGRTLAVLGDELQTADDGSPATSAERFVVMQAALADGYVAALRNRTLQEQESIRLALVEARQQVEKALSASRARFRAVFAEAAIGIAVLDAEHRVVDANPALAALLDGTPEELVGQDLGSFAHPDDAIRLGSAVQRVFDRSDGPNQVEERFADQRGNLVWGRVTLSTIESPAGQPYAVAMIEDITERRLLRAAAASTRPGTTR